MPTTSNHAVAPVDNRTEVPTPTGVQLTPLDEAFRNDPYPILEHVRRCEPIHRDQTLGRWFVSRSEEVREILRDKNLSSSHRNAAPESYMGRVGVNAIESGMAVALETMLFKDDPDHRRLRTLLSRAFSPKAVEALRPRIRANVAALLDKLTDLRFDVVQAFSDPLPVTVICDLMGVKEEDRAAFKSWSEDFTFGFFNPLKIAEQSARGRVALQALGEYFRSAIEARRQQPGDDLISLLVTASQDDERLTNEEIISQCDLLLIAGNITTSDLIANSLKCLLQHPGQLAALRAQPQLITNTIEEVLRYDSPVTQAQRILVADTNFKGCPMHAGQSITLSLAGANRDPAANPEPDRFDILRREIRHQSFGGGKHLCLGAHLARVEAQEAVLGIVQRFPVLKLLDQAFHYRPVPSFRSLKQLWLSRE